jgi:hypothetical protein
MNGQLLGQPHAEDPDHDRIVGIAIDMFTSGRPAKAVVWYNRWAFAARHAPISLLGLEPPTVRFDAGVLTLVDGEIHLSQAEDLIRH